MIDELDLENASEIASFAHRPEDDKDAWTSETLYSLKAGRFMLERKGGMNSELMGATEATVVDAETARSWMNDHAPEKTEEVFGTS